MTEIVTADEFFDAPDNNAPKIIPSEDFFGDDEPENENQFVIGVQDALNKMTGEIKGALSGAATGERGALFEPAMNTTASAIRGGIDVVAEGIKAITPDKLGSELIALYGDILKNSGGGPVTGGLRAVGQKLIDVAAPRIEKFAEQNPRTVRNLEDAFTVGLIMSPVKTTPDSLTIAGRLSQKVTAQANKQVEKRIEVAIDDLARQRPTKAVRERRAVITSETGGISNAKVEPLLPEEKIWADSLRKVPGVDKHKTVQGNLNAVVEENIRLGKKLKADVAANNVRITKEEVEAAFQSTMRELADEPFFIGDTVGYIERFAVQAKKILADAPQTASGLLQARKDIDKLWEKLKGANAFEGNITAPKEAFRRLRGSLNELLAQKVPSVNVRESLRQQSNLYDVTKKALAPKASLIGRNRFVRAWRHTAEIIKERGVFNQIGAVVIFSGGLGAAAVVAPYYSALLAGGGLTYAMWRGLSSVTGKKLIARTLADIDKAIANTADGDIIKTLRADKAALLEILEMKAPDDDVSDVDFEDEE